MRLLRGESLDLLARESGQPAGRISGWREEFLSAGREGLKARPLAAEDVALREAQRKVGELSMELDIVRALLERKEHPAFPRRLRASFATSSRQSSAYSASRCSPQNRSVIARISPTSPRNAAGTRSSLSPAAMTPSSFTFDGCRKRCSVPRTRPRHRPLRTGLCILHVTRLCGATLRP